MDVAVEVIVADVARPPEALRIKVVGGLLREEFKSSAASAKSFDGPLVTLGLLRYSSMGYGDLMQISPSWQGPHFLPVLRSRTFILTCG